MGIAPTIVVRLPLFTELPRRSLLGNPYPGTCIKPGHPERKASVVTRRSYEPYHNMEWYRTKMREGGCAVKRDEECTEN